MTQEYDGSQEIEVYEPPLAMGSVEEDPMAQVERGRRQAEALMSVVEQAGSFVNIGENRYLKVEGWELIGRFNQVSAVTEYVKKLHDDESNLLGYEAKVNLHRQQNGQIVGSGTMVCGIDEFVTQGKTGLSKDNACMSMAQTRATSKAYRLNFSWVAVLAGFQPTPAEEMQGHTSKDPALMCPVHHTEWFKTAKMRTYAHKPVTAGERWCNIDDVLADKEVAAEQYQIEEDQRFQESMEFDGPGPEEESGAAEREP